MPTKLEPGLYLECIECGHFTPVEDGQTPTNTPCEQCDAEEKGRVDSYVTTLVRVSDCPRLGECHDEDHHHGLDQHVTEIPY